jgi:molybdopterin synthase sulfur carrier subunit
MQLTVKLFAYFRDNRFKEKLADYPEGTTVEAIIRSLGIPLDEVGVTMINSRQATSWQFSPISVGANPLTDQLSHIDMWLCPGALARRVPFFFCRPNPSPYSPRSTRLARIA